MKYLIVAAHPDDEILGAGGTIYNLIKKKHEVCICFLCGNAEARKLTNKELTIVEQASNALKVLGVNECSFGDFPNIKFNTVPHIEIVQFIEKMILKYEPDVVITHYKDDLNSDHKITGECCDEAIRYFQRNNEAKEIKKYMYMEVLSSTDWITNSSFSPNYFYEIGREGINKKIEALSKYENAIRRYPHPRSAENISSLAVMRGCQSKLDYAEGFIIAFEREK